MNEERDAPPSYGPSKTHSGGTADRPSSAGREGKKAAWIGAKSSWDQRLHALFHSAVNGVIGWPEKEVKIKKSGGPENM
jgi:hypothetical protein